MSPFTRRHEEAFFLNHRPIARRRANQRPAAGDGFACHHTRHQPIPDQNPGGTPRHQVRTERNERREKHVWCSAPSTKWVYFRHQAPLGAQKPSVEEGGGWRAPPGNQASEPPPPPPLSQHAAGQCDQSFPVAQGVDRRDLPMVFRQCRGHGLYPTAACSSCIPPWQSHP